MSRQKKLILVVVSVCLIFIALFAYTNFNKETKMVGKILSVTGLVEVKKDDDDKLIKVFKNMALTSSLQRDV